MCDSPVYFVKIRPVTNIPNFGDFFTIKNSSNSTRNISRTKIMTNTLMKIRNLLVYRTTWMCS